MCFRGMVAWVGVKGKLAGRVLQGWPTLDRRFFLAEPVFYAA